MVFKIALAAVCGVAVLSTTPADAKIRCNGQYQIIQGSEHATPWCQDNYLARVARQYGSRLTARQVRQNPFAKEQACRLAGHDIRVSDICAGELGRGDSRRYR